MRVLIIPEDPSLDQYILKPIIEQIFKDLGQRARVEVLWEPRLRGVAQALDQTMVAGIIADYAMVDLFLLMVDRDCDRMGNVAQAAAREQEHRGRLIACLAIEEVEVWMLALHRDSIPAGWQEIRRHCDPKEAFADPFLRSRGWLDRDLVGKGRKEAMRSLGTAWRGVLQVCEELAALQERIRKSLGAG